MSEARRPIKSRSNGAIQSLAARLARSAVTPNQISSASVAFAGVGALALLFPAHWASMLLAIAAIQLRLLCNVTDGLVAVEGGKKSPLGALYNEFPDRIADSLLLIAAGYGAGWPTMGWAAALLAALTAYVRVFGGSIGLEQQFLGPMAKQHRMAVLCVACLICIFEVAASRVPNGLQLGLIIIIAGSAATCVVRTLALARSLGGFR